MATTSRSCFVIMPFAEGFNPVMEAIREAVQRIRRGIDCVRLDEQKRAGMIPEAIEKEIAASEICIADLTGLNANVMWEVGYAMAMKRPVIFISQREQKLPFDIDHYLVVRYNLAALSDPSDSTHRKLTVHEIASALDKTLDKLPAHVALSDAAPAPKAPPEQAHGRARWIAPAATAGVALTVLAGLYALWPECRCDLIHVALGAGPISIDKETSIKLVHVDTLKGKREAKEECRDGPQEGTIEYAREGVKEGQDFNRSLPNAEEVVGRILIAAGLETESAKDILGMTQEQWDCYRLRLPNRSKGFLTDYPFVKFEVEQGTKRFALEKYYFNDDVVEIHRDGDPPIRLRLEHIYNTKASSGEPESVALRLIEENPAGAIPDQKSRRPR